MINKDLVDLCYESTANYYKKISDKQNVNIDFATICDNLKKYAKISDAEFSKVVGSFYVDLLQDNRFVFLGNDKWTLKENISLDCYKKNLNSFYNDVDLSSFKEDYDEEIFNENTIDDEDVEIYEENENELSRDSFDSDLDSDDFVESDNNAEDNKD